MKRYEGTRVEDGVQVSVDGRPLNPRFDLRNHSPTGFEWGYCGSGPAQLALAILADCLTDEGEALKWYQDFKAAVIAAFPYAGWTLTEGEIRRIIQQFNKKEKGSTVNETHTNMEETFTLLDRLLQ